MKKVLLFLLLAQAIIVHSQIPDHIYKTNIHSVKLYKAGDIYSYPIMSLRDLDPLELHFDDMDADIKNYYYTYQLCNADWTPADLQPFVYIRDFQTTRITTYRNSTMSNTRYTHYQAIVPDKNCVPLRSGNYLLKVFLDSDTSRLVFTKRFLIVDSRVSVAANFLTPYNPQITKSDQRVRIGVSTVNSQITTLNPQDLKIVVLQNNTWLNAAWVDRPTIFRGNYFEYNDDATTFPGGREWRWLDLRSLRLMSDRVRNIIDTSKETEVFVTPDRERRGLIYVFYRDLNGIYTIENTDGNNPYWQSDYGYVHFTFEPPAHQAYPGKDIYLFGELTNYSFDDNSRMIFNEEKGIYEGTLFLKQGYYSYAYVSMDSREKDFSHFSFDNTEGNFNLTENNYTILVYYRAFGARADELLGFAQLNSITGR